MKEDERRFLIDVYEKCRSGTSPFDRISPKKLINQPDFYMHYKRAWYLLGKWCDKGWYEFGVALDCGWLTAEGKEYAKNLGDSEVKPNEPR
jgi:hypothetical protein